jgi:hypothetical protein
LFLFLWLQALHHLCFAYIGFFSIPDEVLFLILSFYPAVYFGSVSRRWKFGFRTQQQQNIVKFVSINDSPMPFELRCRSENAFYVRVSCFPYVIPKAFTDILYLRLGVHSFSDWVMCNSFLCEFQGSNPYHRFKEISVDFTVAEVFSDSLQCLPLQTLHLDLTFHFLLCESSIHRIGCHFGLSRSVSLRLQNGNVSPPIDKFVMSFSWLRHLHIQGAPYIPHPEHIILPFRTCLPMHYLSTFTCYIQSPDYHSSFDIFDWCLSGEHTVRIELRWILTEDCPFDYSSNVSDFIYSWEYRGSQGSAIYYGYAFIMNAGRVDAGLSSPPDPITPGSWAPGTNFGHVCDSVYTVPKLKFWVRQRRSRMSNFYMRRDVVFGNHDS